MALGIGIDTGGTYTDAVVYDFEKRCVIAKAKSRTTKEDLSQGIGASLDLLPQELVKQAQAVALSTTLATNACVENKGCRAKLVLMGTPQKVLRRIDAEHAYGLPYDDVLCLDTHSSFDGSFVDEPDWKRVVEENAAWFSDAQALSLCEAQAARNGALAEKNGKAFLRESFSVPIVLGSELSSDVNMMARGATALLNARLLPVIEEFLQAAARALDARGVDAPIVIVRSDGGLMGTDLALDRPVETILSGPAASVYGSRELADRPNCLIVDMGGTTTDISLVIGGEPVMSSGIRIGQWQTQAKGVFIETFGLGGDSAIRLNNGLIDLATRRVEPICAAVARWPELAAQIESLLDRPVKSPLPVYEVLYLVHEPASMDGYNGAERELIEELRRGPLMLGDTSRIDLYAMDSERLESEGVVMRAGLTPTDIMHVKGDFDRYDPAPARTVVRYLCGVVPDFDETDQGVQDFCDAVYDLMEYKLYAGIVKILMRNRYPKGFGGGFPDSFEFILKEEWRRARTNEGHPLFDFGFTTPAVLVGIGAPTHLFLPAVARALRTEAVVPEHAEVANAVGAIVADVKASASVHISPMNAPGGVEGYVVHAKDGSVEFEDRDDAVAYAREEALRQVSEEARRRGARYKLDCTVEVKNQTSRSGYGDAIDLGAVVVAEARSVMFAR